MRRKNVDCDQCEKQIRGKEKAYFSDPKKNLDFCSKKCRLEWNEKWKNIHPDFTEGLGKEWTNLYQGRWEWRSEKSFLQAVQNWIKAGLEPTEAKFAKWLEHKGYIPNEEQRDRWDKEEAKKQKTFQLTEKETLKQEYLNDKWASINLYFTKKDWSKKPNQQNWEERGFTYQDAEILISVGFTPWEYERAKLWKNHNFTPQQTKSWIDIGLKTEDYEFAAYLRNQGYSPSSLPLNLKEETTAQNFLDCFYPSEQRSTIKELDVKEKNLAGNLDLSDFENLEKLNCSKNKLTSLKLDNCEKLEDLICWNNQLITLDLSKCVNLKRIYCSNNRLTEIKLPKGEKLEGLGLGYNNFKQDLSFLEGLVNLKELSLNNSPFYGSLKPLQNLRELKSLSLNGTDIDSGLEYLPESVKLSHSFLLGIEERKDVKFKKIRQVLGGKTPKQWKTEWKQKKEKYLDNNLLNRSDDIQKNIYQFFGGYSNQEIKNLKDPELMKRRYAIEMGQWTGRGLSAIGGALVLKGTADENKQYAGIGGVLAILGPFMEGTVSRYEKKYYEVTENKWDRFLQDSKGLWNDYQELIKILEFFEVFYGDSTKELVDSIEELEEELKKKEKGFTKREERQGLIETKKRELTERIGEKNCQLWFLSKKLQRVYKKEKEQPGLWEKINEKYLPHPQWWEETKKVLEAGKEKIGEKLINLNKSLKEKANNIIREKIDIENYFDLKEKDEKENKDLITKNEFAQDLQKNWEQRKKQWENVREMLLELNKEQESTNNNESVQKYKEWFNISSELNPEKDLDFILWLKDKKSKELENFADPQWLKGKIATRELDLNELKKEYQQNKEEKIEVIIDVDENSSKEENKQKSPEQLQEENSLLRQRVKELEKQVQQVAQILQPTNPGSSKNN